jgi:hypothetical protein
MFFLPTDGNFYEKHGKFLRPDPVQNYNNCMKQVDKSTNLTAQLRPLTDNTQKKQRSYISTFQSLSFSKMVIILASQSSKLSH